MAIDIQTVKFGDQIYDVGQILGKSLIASVDLNTRTYPDTKAPLYHRFKAGDNLGAVYSYIVKNGQLWWQFEYTENVYTKKNFYALHNAKVYSIKALKQQGAKTMVKQIAENKEFEKSLTGEGGLFDFSSLGKNIKWILIAAIIAGVIYLSIQSGIFKKLRK